MLEPIPSSPPAAPRPVPPLLGELPNERVDLAKWPPDDDGNAPAGGGGQLPGAGSPGSFDTGDGDFKKGRFNPFVILIGLVAVIGLGLFLFIGLKKDAEKLTVEQVEDRKKATFILPKDEQMPKWREWAASEASDELVQESLKQLAFAKDPAGVDLAIKALARPSEPIQAMAATCLTEYGLPAAESAKGPLMQALTKAGPGAKPQIAWALVVLGEAASFDKIMELYRAGYLSKVQRLGGGVAFDPEQIVKLIDTDKLATYAGDESPAVRQLVATVLSRNAAPKYTDVLIKLVQDSDAEIARQAAPGLGKIGDKRAREPLISALKKTDKESRKKYLNALKDGIGAEGLILALDSNDSDIEKSWYQTKVVIDLVRELADPRCGDPILKYLETKPNIHWQTEAATAMAEVGDVRGVPTLARRLRMDPLKIYGDQYDHEQLLKRDDQERVVAARMIADLAVLYPDQREFIRKESEDAVIFWIHEMPSPHANGLRALAAMESTKDINALRKWADPNKPLPKEGQQPPFPEEWVVAQSAMRYVGWLKDEQSWSVLEKSLTRRDPELDVTMDGLMAGGLAILGMTLRAIGVGAADGMAQWQDPKAFKPLMKYIEEPKENEQSRKSACAALPWVASKEDMLEVAKKVQEYKKTDKDDSLRRECLLEAFIRRPVPGIAGALLPMLTPDAALETRHQVGAAIGKTGFDKEVEAKLFEMLKSESLVTDAANALILGGTPDVAKRAVAMLADKPKATVEELQNLWYDAFGYWSHEDLTSGRIFRWVDNAIAIQQTELKGVPQDWAPFLLMKQFDNLQYDNGPHSFTRVVLRVRLMQMAKDASKKEMMEGAIRTLKFMKEQGVLLALRDEKGPTGELASAAYFELMNPKVITDVKVPEDGKGGGKGKNQ
ncbi:MAG: HEAT repeat domain-containing protein [Myxococcales bacterium]|nr:HEAT repeat domain-containing protein [Myxococcales bacterium]